MQVSSTSAKVALCRDISNLEQKNYVELKKYILPHPPLFFQLMARQRSHSADWPLPVAPPAPGPLCGLCEREVQATSRHHLVPREEGGKYGPTVDLCQPCHSSVHRFLTNRDLARRYPSIELLRSAEELQTYLNWIRRQRIERIANRRGRR
jgi:5-methylcytosine-specific restriction protein A